MKKSLKTGYQTLDIDYYTDAINRNVKSVDIELIFNFRRFLLYFVQLASKCILPPFTILHFAHIIHRYC